MCVFVLLIFFIIAELLWSRFTAVKGKLAKSPNRKRLQPDSEEERSSFPTKRLLWCQPQRWVVPARSSAAVKHPGRSAPHTATVTVTATLTCGANGVGSGSHIGTYSTCAETVGDMQSVTFAWKSVRKLFASGTSSVELITQSLFYSCAFARWRS